VPLRTELVLFMYRDALERVPFFQGKDPLFIADVVSHLKLQYFSPVGTQGVVGPSVTMGRRVLGVQSSASQ
jgi:hypothetical protein